MIKYNTQLDDEFKKIGFLNFKDFVQTATPLVISEQLQLDCYLMDDAYSDPDDIGYIFIVRKNDNSENWCIVSVRTSYQLSTERNIEGVIVIGKEYKEDIPVKEVIRNELLESVRIEKLKDRFCRLEHNKNTICKKFKR